MMEVKEFFEKDDEYITSYDFTNDVLEKQKVDEGLKRKYLDNKIDIVEKYILYKTEEQLKIDPDTNNVLLKDILSNLYSEDILKICFCEKYQCYSDTTTSAQGLLNGYYHNYYKVKGKKVSINLMKSLYDNKDNDFFNNVVNNHTIRDFLKYYHTLGNYIPVPPGFNQARSGNYASHDMWDITLIKIKDYYDKKKEKQSTNVKAYMKSLVELLHCNSILPTKKWLDAFDCWENFVDKNYLKEKNGHKNYVDEGYSIRKLANHDFNNPQIKSNENEEESEAYLNYFKEITDIIKGRTLIMKEKLQCEKNKRSLIRKWRNFMICYCMSDIHGYLNAFNEALNLVINQFDKNDTKLILLGDYIHGGEENYEVLDKIMELQYKYGSDKVIALLGNHEETACEGRDSINGYNFENSDTSDMDDKYINWMLNLPRYYVEGKTIFVHAGIDEETEEMWE